VRVDTNQLDDTLFYTFSERGGEKIQKD